MGIPVCGLPPDYFRKNFTPFCAPLLRRVDGPCVVVKLACLFRLRFSLFIGSSRRFLPVAGSARAREWLDIQAGFERFEGPCGLALAIVGVKFFLAMR
jgi:hypothetical protein